jgi:hypothetical protein
VTNFDPLFLDVAAGKFDWETRFARLLRWFLSVYVRLPCAFLLFDFDGFGFAVAFQ